MISILFSQLPTLRRRLALTVLGTLVLGLASLRAQLRLDQLSSIDTTGYAARYWPWFRNEQRKLADEIAHVGMAVSSDVGARRDVHPTDKRTVGQRHFAIRPAAAPRHLPRRARDRVVPLRGQRTEHRRPPAATGFYHRRAASPTRFRAWENRGADVPRRPDFVFYGWAPYTEANLVNSAGLPASTFKLPVPPAQ